MITSKRNQTIQETNRIKLQEAAGQIKVGMKVRTNGDGSHTTEPFEGVVGEVRQTCFFVFSDIEEGTVGKVSPLSRGYSFSSLIRFASKGWIEILDEEDDFEVKYILKYDTNHDPIEEFNSLEGVKARINELVEKANEIDLDTNSIIVYKVEKSYPVSVGVQISGL
jgi:hypothetical protein